MHKFKNQMPGKLSLREILDNPAPRTVANIHLWQPLRCNGCGHTQRNYSGLYLETRFLDETELYPAHKPSHDLPTLNMALSVKRISSCPACVPAENNSSDTPAPESLRFHA